MCLTPGKQTSLSPLRHVSLSYPAVLVFQLLSPPQKTLRRPVTHVPRKLAPIPLPASFNARSTSVVAPFAAFNTQPHQQHPQSKMQRHKFNLQPPRAAHFARSWRARLRVWQTTPRHGGL